MKKNSSKGESLVESLTALLILTILMVGFTSIIVSSNKVNNMLKEQPMAYSADRSTDNEIEITVSISDAETGGTYANYSDTSYGVVGYKDGDFYFYEFKEE